MTIAEKSVELHGKDLNCAQSVLGACSEFTGIDENLSNAVALGFGGGVRAGEVCGSISGAVMAIGKYCTDRNYPELVAGYSKALVNEFRKHTALPVVRL
jgi:C_GCAxxG_C_C family probable redox protein